MASGFPETMRHSIVFLCLFLFAARAGAESQSRVAFGSCADTRRSQAFWQTLIDARPDVFIFLGDNVYADTFDPAVYKAAFARLEKIEGFRRLRAAVPLLATWDDHDYGINDSGKEHPNRAAAQNIFLDFVGVPEDSP